MTVTGPGSNDDEKRTVWTIHDEWSVDDTRRLDLRIAHVELPDGVHFEQYVLRMPKVAVVAPLDQAEQNVLMIYRHRFIMNQWTWELPGGYVDSGETPEECAFREVEEETGWRAGRIEPLGQFQPLAGTADFQNIVFVARDCTPTDRAPDINEAARVEWIPLSVIRNLIRDGSIMGAAAQICLLHLLLP